jgi:hypothetical protein
MFFKQIHKLFVQFHQQQIASLAPEQRQFISRVKCTFAFPLLIVDSLDGQVQSGHNVFLTGLGGTGKSEHPHLHSSNAKQTNANCFFFIGAGRT